MRCSLTRFTDIPEAEAAISAVEKILGVTFRDPRRLLESLVHSSYSNERGLADRTTKVNDNERLEFLGDAVIGLVVASFLMERFPDANEGRLSRWRSSLVSRKTLADLALNLRLGDFILLGRGERQTGGAEKRSLLAAVFEAIVGALYLDAGLPACSEFLRSVYEPILGAVVESVERFAVSLDKKTYLQELTQKHLRVIPAYRVIDSWGKEHEKTFRVEIQIGDRVIGHGEGRSKKEAEQEAANLALQVMEF